jgi:adenylate cyclase
MAIDFENEGLLEGLDGAAREARRELLEQLANDGIGLEELRQATEEGRLPLLPVERLIGGDEQYSLDEIVDASGLPAQFLERLWRALGLAMPDAADRRFTDADLDAARRVRAFRDAGLSEESILEIGRVMSRAMASVAATIGNVFIDTYLRPGDNERDLALRYAATSKGLIPYLGPVLEHVLRVQQLGLIRQAAVDASSLEAGHLPGAVEMSICFADLVGFTKLGESLDAIELGRVAERLEELAGDVAEAPVRLIKTIGDAVMLASRDGDALLAAALSLVESADEEGEGFPPLRAGVARGDVIGRGGDWYGRPVNLASRITGIARPGSVLAAEAVKEAAGTDLSWSFAGKRRIKGLDGETALFRVRRAGAQA